MVAVLNDPDQIAGGVRERGEQPRPIVNRLVTHRAARRQSVAKRDPDVGNMDPSHGPGIRSRRAIGDPLPDQPGGLKTRFGRIHLPAEDGLVEPRGRGDVEGRDLQVAELPAYEAWNRCGLLLAFAHARLRDGGGRRRPDLSLTVLSSFSAKPVRADARRNAERI